MYMILINCIHRIIKAFYVVTEELVIYINLNTGDHTKKLQSKDLPFFLKDIYKTNKNK